MIQVCIYRLAVRGLQTKGWLDAQRIFRDRLQTACLPVGTTCERTALFLQGGGCSQFCACCTSQVAAGWLHLFWDLVHA
jgi:hypothetical protein